LPVVPQNEIRHITKKEHHRLKLRRQNKASILISTNNAISTARNVKQALDFTDRHLFIYFSFCLFLMIQCCLGIKVIWKS